LQSPQVEGQLAAFAEQLGSSAPRGAAACRRLLTDSAAAASGTATHSVQLSVRRSYRLVEHGAEDDDSSEHNAVTVWVDDWDAGAPWQPWASYMNPVGEAARALSPSQRHVWHTGHAEHASSRVRPSRMCKWSHGMCRHCAGSLELDLKWNDVPAAAVLQQPGTVWRPAEANTWQLHVLAPQPQAARSIFALQVHEYIGVHCNFIVSWVSWTVSQS
jgi:hypothetical protein